MLTHIGITTDLLSNAPSVGRGYGSNCKAIDKTHALGFYTNPGQITIYENDNVIKDVSISYFIKQSKMRKNEYDEDSLRQTLAGYLYDLKQKYKDEHSNFEKLTYRAITGQTS